MLSVLSIGTDKKVFEEGSSVLERQKEYAKNLEELHLIVFTSGGFEKQKVGNLWIYPTNSYSKLFYILDAFIIAKKILRDKRSFVVTVQDPFETALVGLKIKSKFNLPLQIQIHTDFLDPYFKNNFLNRIRVFISKITIPKADGIRVVSSVIKDSLVKRYPNMDRKINILPIWIDIEKFLGNSYETEKINNSILMVSRLSKEKRIDIALFSLKKIIDSGYADLSLTIIGSGPQKKKIYDLIKELNLGNNVKLLGWDNEVINAYKKASIFLSTSEFEGYGMTLIEAGASGCSIVTTRVGVAKTDIFRDGINSYVCPVADIECLSKKLLDLITNEEKRKSFAKNMRDNIKEVSISKQEYINTYISLLEKILK